VAERRLVLPPAIRKGEPNVPGEARPILHGKVKAGVRPRKVSREGAKTQREGADKLEALGHELEAKAAQIKTEIQRDKRK